MDIRPCPRCGKLCPTFASFCRRCGVSTAAPARQPPRPPAEPQHARRASTVASTAMATLAILLTLFAFPSLRRTCPGYGRRPPHYYNVPTGDRVVDVPGDALVERDDQPADYFESAGTVRADDGAPDSRGDSPRVTHPVPQVTRLAGPFAGAGHKVTVVGAGLAATTHVYFLASDGRSGEARFRTWDDVRLMVVVPDLGSRPSGATVVVETPDGTTTPAEFYYTGR